MCGVMAMQVNRFDTSEKLPKIIVDVAVPSGTLDTLIPTKWGDVMMANADIHRAI